ncbi:MAG: ATP-binding protein [Treponema sp.]|nr:ATP-binding protein [Treponema sp.]
MGNFTLNSRVQKSRIAARTRTIYILLLVLVLTLITATAAVMITGITNDASRNFARLYSVETMDKFNSFMNQEFVLVHIISNTKAITDWYADEDNQAKKEAAYNLIMSYTGMVQNPFLYFCINRDLNEYYLFGNSSLDDFIPFDRINPSDAYNQWYFGCIDSPAEYSMNIDNDKVTGIARLWINHQVMDDKKNIVGALCSGLSFEEVNRSLFAGYDVNKVKGYIIDRNGFVMMDSSQPEFIDNETHSMIPETVSDPALAAAIKKRLDKIDGYFSADGQPEIINLNRGANKFVSIVPITGSDWSVVTFFNSSSLFSVMNLLPLLIVILSAFILYALAVNTMIQRFLLVPINRLTKSVSESGLVTSGFFGHDRDDEIGILARTIQKSAADRLHLEQLLHAVNSASAMLLATADENNYESSLTEGMGIMGRCVDADRVNILQNESFDSGQFFIQQFEWLSEAGRTGRTIEKGTLFRYSLIVETGVQFIRGECLNGPVKNMQQEARDFFDSLGIKSILVIPVFVQDKLWGMVSFADCRTERSFTEEEVNILRSGSLMMVSALNRSIQAKNLREARENTQVLLDAMPAACELWNSELEIFDCNGNAMELFEVKDKETYIREFFNLCPEYQPDGRLSTEAGISYLRQAFSEGRCFFEWMRRTTSGIFIPTYVTLVRVRFGDEFVVAGYARDLREHKQMMNEIEQRDRLLNAANNAAADLLQAETGEFESGLYRCMGMLAEPVEADRVFIWQNQTVNGLRYSSLLFEWPTSVQLRQTKKYFENVLYSDVAPGYGEILARGDCMNGLVRDMPQQAREQLAPQGILSILLVPVIVRNGFWGFVGYANCHRERIFTKNEESILRSASMLMASSWLRYDITLNIRATAAKLEAVIANYPGIIWCVDKNKMITLFNGRYLNETDLKPSFFEGRLYTDVLQEERFKSICECTEKTFTDGIQDRNYEIGDRVYRLRTAPICDDDGVIVTVIGNFDDITERTKLQAELKAALTAAQDASSAKTDFLANMSHEMRTPLNAIIGLSELTLGINALDSESYSNLEKINNAGMTLLGMVNDILDISKIEAGKFELVPAEYDMPSLMNDTITQSILHIGEKPIRFNLEIGEDLPTRLYGDDLRIKQIFNNLLTNAFKYTSSGTVELGLSCERDGQIVWLTARISDTGIGIRSEDIGNLFKDYTQLDIRSNRKIEGTGLGLPITKSMVDMMDGTISVQSEYGKGSVFTVRLKQQFVTDEKIGPEVVKNLKNFTYSDQKRKNKSRMVRISLPYARVLVVDDVSTNLDVARGMMKPYGMQIDCVSNGQEAIDAIRAANVKYNAVFMDHMMPGMDGMEATRIIREEIGTEYARTVPIIALTANAIVGNEEMFLGRGFQAFISKPIDMERLDAVIREWVRDNKKEKEQPVKESQAVQETASKTDWQSMEKFCDYIDIKKGLERFGSKNSYLQILHSFISSSRGLLQTIREVNPDTIKNYITAVHGIKGTSRGVCVYGAGDRAEELEKAAREGNYDFITEKNTAFADDLQNIIDRLDELLEQTAAENPYPKKTMPDRDVLEKLSQACGAFDMNGADEAMIEIEKYEYESDNEIKFWLRKNLNNMNLGEIQEKVSLLLASG